MNRIALVLVLPLSLLVGCEAQVGDACEVSLDCTPNGDLCLTEELESFPGGYCSEFACSAGSCEGDAACVAFRGTVGNTTECQGPLASQRLSRRFCMARCTSDNDCRDGYACIDLEFSANPWSAEVLEPEEGTRICTLPAQEQGEVQFSSEVCGFATVDRAQRDSGAADAARE